MHCVWQVNSADCCCRPSKSSSKHLLNVESAEYDDLADGSVRSERTEQSMTQVRSTAAFSGRHGRLYMYGREENWLHHGQKCWSFARKCKLMHAGLHERHSTHSCTTGVLAAPRLPTSPAAVYGVPCILPLQQSKPVDPQLACAAESINLFNSQMSC